MRKLLVLTAFVLVGGFCGSKTPTAFAHSDATHVAKVKFYKANGVVKWIGRHARFTQYNPDKKVKRKWQKAVTYWMGVRKHAWQVLHPAPAVGHWAGWSCITNGAYPGAAHEGNGYNGSYTGRLGMTTPWAGHYPSTGDWVTTSAEETYGVAEKEAAKHGWSYLWMKGQWPNTYPPCAGLF